MKEKMRTSEALKTALRSISKTQANANGFNQINFSLMNEAECRGYVKVAKKQKEGYTKYLSEKHHVSVGKLIEERRRTKNAGKLAKQLSNQKI